MLRANNNDRVQSLVQNPFFCGDLMHQRRAILCNGNPERQISVVKSTILMAKSKSIEAIG